MDNRVYYGEYSLAYWIELLLTKKLILPKYQRYFVWSEKRLESLIDSFKDKRFVPPVTIGYFKENGTPVNYIIDGQQRLTSILLAYLGKFPNKETYKAQLKTLAEGDNTREEEEEYPDEDVLRWNLESLTKKGCLKDEILSKLSQQKYKDLNLDEKLKDKDFWNSTFMGFSYIVPGDETASEQQKYYTKVFREINRQGVNLIPLESRKSLYFLNKELELFFEPDFVKNFKVTLIAEEQQMDYVRYLSLLSEYKKAQTERNVGRGFSGNMEQYYENYIYSVVNAEKDNTFEPFETIFPDNKYDNDLKRLTQTISDLQIPKSYASIINMDIYFFGLIYYTLFMHKTVKSTEKAKLKEDIENKIAELKVDNGHAQSPAKFKYLRKRIGDSITIYHKYLIP